VKVGDLVLCRYDTCPQVFLGWYEEGDSPLREDGWAELVTSEGIRHIVHRDYFFKIEEKDASR